VCFSPEMSGVVAVTGTIGTGVLIKKKVPKMQTFTFFYFAFLMEALQFFQYLFINLCDNIFNIRATDIAYVHLTFQPIVVNAFCLSLLDETKRKKFSWVWIPAVITTASWLLGFSNFFDACEQNNWCSGGTSCSISGMYHIAWKFSVNILHSIRFFNLIPLIGIAWLFCFFVLPALMRVWIWVIPNLIFLTGSMLLVGFLKSGEWTAVWCFSSIFIIAIILLKKPKGEN
jgi:hypothetical protein